MILEKKTHNSYKLTNKHSNHILRYGSYGIKVVSFGKLTKNQLDSLSRFLVKIFKKFKNKKSIKFWNLVFLNLNLTKLSSESRMGKGKGSIYTKAAFVRPGNIIFEFEGLTNQQVFKLFLYIQKLTCLKLVLIKN